MSNNSTILTPLNQAGQTVSVQTANGAVVQGVWHGTGTPVMVGNTPVWPTK